MEPGRRPFVLFVLAAIALAVAIACLAPASLLDSRLASATGGVLRLANTHGTLWQGRGVVAAANTRIPVAWNTDFWPLLRGVMHMRVRSDVGADGPRSTIDVRADGITLQDTDITIPAATVGSALGDMAAGLIDGEVNASTSGLHLAAGANSGEARLTWRNARIRGIAGPLPLELGEVRTGLAADGTAMSGSIVNDGGRLALRGAWSLKEKDSLTLAMQLTPRNAADPELRRWLAAVGTPEGDGWRVNWRLPLR